MAPRCCSSTWPLLVTMAVAGGARMQGSRRAGAQSRPARAAPPTSGAGAGARLVHRRLARRRPRTAGAGAGGPRRPRRCDQRDTPGPGRRPVAAWPLVRGAVERWRGVAARRERSLALEWEAGQAIVMADPARLAQALDNLLANAIEHGALRVVVRCSRVMARCGSRLPARPARPPARTGTRAEATASPWSERRGGPPRPVQPAQVGAGGDGGARAAARAGSAARRSDRVGSGGVSRRTRAIAFAARRWSAPRSRPRWRGTTGARWRPSSASFGRWWWPAPRLRRGARCGRATPESYWRFGGSPPASLPSTRSPTRSRRSAALLGRRSRPAPTSPALCFASRGEPGHGPRSAPAASRWRSRSPARAPWRREATRSAATTTWSRPVSPDRAAATAARVSSPRT